MEVSETKKTNKPLLLVTYCFAVVCLIAGLFVPLYEGDKILALQLPELFTAIVGNGDHTLAHISIINFGSETFSLNFTALALVLYAVVTALALLSVIPIGICFKKDTNADKVIAYIIETAAVLVLSLNIISALDAISNNFSAISLTPEPITFIDFNIIIALGGSLLALVIFSIANKKSTGVAKVFLFLLSAIALFVLFDLTAIIPALSNIGETFPLPFSMYERVTGINLLSCLFSDNYGAILQSITEVKLKAEFVLGTILALAVIFNYLLDVISLSTNAKNKGLLFNIVRYGFELAAAVCLLITAAVCGNGIGLFLIVIAALALICLAMNIIRFIMAKKKAKAEKEAEDRAPMFARPSKPPKQKKPEERTDDIIVDVPEVTPEEVPFVGAEPIVIDEKPVPEKPEEVSEQMAFIEPAPEPVIEKEPEEEPLTVHPDEVQMEIEGTQPEEIYNEPVWGPVWDTVPEPVAPRPAPLAEPAVIQPEPVAESEPAAALVSEPKPVVPEPTPVAPQPVVSEPKPERPVISESAPAPRPIQPVSAPAQPAPEVKSEPKPVQRYNYGTDGEMVYTIRYGGPSDDFMNKLTNDEKIEFAMTFIERSKGDVGNIPEYTIGGNNKKFFSAVFIYLGRIRGMISDGLLNKMFKELNML